MGILASSSGVGMPLYITADAPRQMAPLFTWSFIEESGEMPLFTDGNQPSGVGMPLYMNGAPQPVSGEMPLYLFAPATGVITGNHTLYINGINGVPTQNRICLFINTVLPSGGLDLVTWGGYPAHTDRYPTGDGGAWGYIPITDSITVYVNGS